MSSALHSGAGDAPAAGDVRSWLRAARSVTGRLVPHVLLAILVPLSFLPIFEWLPVDLRATMSSNETALRTDWYARLIESWLLGSVIVAGGAVALVLLARHVPALWAGGAIVRRLGASAAGARAGLLTALVAGILYALVSNVVFDRRPLLIDEITHLLQAKIFAQGRLWADSGAYPEFFSTMLMVDHEGRHFSQMLPGVSALLSLGVLIGAPWIVGPLCGAAAVAAWHDILRTARERGTVIIGATVIFAFAPFAVFMAGSYMGHMPTLMWLMLGIAALMRTVTRAGGAWRPAVLAGFAFGAAAITRPVEAIAFAFPAGLWLLALVVRRRLPWSVLAASGVALAVPISLGLWVSAQMTGEALRLGYDLQWGQGHGLGFHAAPWGAEHTPLRGLARTNLYLLRLQEHFLELPIPSLVPAFVSFLLTRRRSAIDRYLLVCGMMLVGLYFTYWFDAYWLGPRYYHPLLALLALWTARFPAAVQERWGAGEIYRGSVYALVIAVLVAIPTTLRLRTEHYASMMPSLRWDVETIAAQNGVRNSLVFVRETWGAQLLVRLWTLGVPRTAAERLYYSIDACRLEHALTDLEASGTRGDAARARLRALTADSAKLVESPVSPDRSERYLPGATYSKRCIERLRSDITGTTLLAPQLLAGRHGNIFARDLNERNLALVAQHPERPLFLLRASDTTFAAPLRFIRLRRDSVVRTWRAAAESLRARVRRESTTAAYPPTTGVPR